MIIDNSYAEYFKSVNQPIFQGFSYVMPNFVSKFCSKWNFNLWGNNTTQFAFQPNNWWSSPNIYQPDLNNCNMDTFQRTTLNYNTYTPVKNYTCTNITPSWGMSFNASPSLSTQPSNYSGVSRNYGTGQSTIGKPSRVNTSRTTGGIDTFSMSSLDLKGNIAGCNSVPSIAKRNAENLKALDKILTDWGYDVTYTSAMGGEHVSGSGHYEGNKVDIQLAKNGKSAHLTSKELGYLKQQGYWGTGTGAVGWEAHDNQAGGGHYDLCIA